jgi:hypothetical protein
VTIVLQFGIAAIPVGIWGEWGVMMITAAGTLGALAAGALPQWRAEKLPSRRNSKKNFAISSGNVITPSFPQQKKWILILSRDREI